MWKCHAKNLECDIENAEEKEQLFSPLLFREACC
jgi:hypothetical protein